jgi:hypothetical protein
MQKLGNKGSTEEIDEDIQDNTAVEEVTKCTNSTGTFVPPYWSFIFSDSDLQDYVS